MSTIVLVHGIAQEQGAADTLEAAWLPALAGGVRIAGHSELADRIWRAGYPAGPGGISVRMAYYGDLFRTPGAQGSHDPSNDVADPDLAEDLAQAWLSAAATRGTPRDRATAQRALTAQHADGAQGPRAALRPAMNVLAALPYFAPFGMALAGRFVARTLHQVTLYLTREDVRAQAQQRVLDLIDDDTRLVIGHSLGSVVAYETLHRVTQPLALITLGSPLGLRGVVYDRLQPQPPTTPACLTTWTNAADADDIVAATTDLRPLFPPHSARGPIPYLNLPADNGAHPHDATHYLTKRSLGASVHASLATTPS